MRLPLETQSREAMSSASFHRQNRILHMHNSNPCYITDTSNWNWSRYTSPFVTVWKCEWWKTDSQDIETCCAHTCTPPVFVCGGLSITGANHLSASPDGSTEACGNDGHTRLLLTTDMHIQYTHSHNLYLLLFNHTIQKGYMASLFYVYSDHAVNKGQ